MTDLIPQDPHSDAMMAKLNASTIFTACAVNVAVHAGSVTFVENGDRFVTMPGMDISFDCEDVGENEITNTDPRPHPEYVKGWNACLDRFPIDAAPEVVAQDWEGDWKRMDGAAAWHLIDRHAEGWAEVGAMMEAWRLANC